MRESPLDDAVHARSAAGAGLTCATATARYAGYMMLWSTFVLEKFSSYSVLKA